VPVTNLHRDEILDASQLPLSYVAATPCFRVRSVEHTCRQAYVQTSKVHTRRESGTERGAGAQGGGGRHGKGPGLQEGWRVWSVCLFMVSVRGVFQAEAGSYGRDTKGLLRQHQFLKVCSP
jgi:hypothetical protein